jgi:hypothetical protein
MVHSLVAISCSMIQITCTETEDQRVYIMVWKPFRPFCPSRGKWEYFFLLSWFADIFFARTLCLYFPCFSVYLPLYFQFSCPVSFIVFFLLPWNADIYFSRRYQYPFTFIFYAYAYTYLPFYIFNLPLIFHLFLFSLVFILPSFAYIYLLIFSFPFF